MAAGLRPSRVPTPTRQRRRSAMKVKRPGPRRLRTALSGTSAAKIYLHAGLRSAVRPSMERGRGHCRAAGRPPGSAESWAGTTLARCHPSFCPP